MRKLTPAPNGSLPGIARNLARGSLEAVALSATSYAGGDSVTWVEGKAIELWQRPQRRSESARLTVEHVMASSALPMLFPAVRVGDEWFGDGGIRLTAPLSPALHLGATRILTISTHHHPVNGEPEVAPLRGYPPPAQVLGVLYNSVFLDLIDEDILRLRRANRVLSSLAPEQREGMHVVEIMVIRPSLELRGLVHDLEPELPRLLRYLTRGLGTRQASNPDFLSLLLFQRDYIGRLVELGEADVAAHADSIGAFLDPEPEGP
jgi:NTE family protein